MKRLAAVKHSSCWWLRSPNVGNTNNVYYVSTSGASSNNNANNAYGFSLDCITELKYGLEESNFRKEKETSDSCKELQTLPHINHVVNKNRRRWSLDKIVSPTICADPFSFQNLLVAAHECSLGVLWKDSVMRWHRDRLHLCRKLEKELFMGRYKLSQYVTFDIVSPKRRTIRSLHFRDRVVQRAMCNNGLYADLTRSNIYDNGACQKHKGTRFTLDRMKVLLQRYYRENGADGWVLRLDVHKFFDSIPHDKLCEMVRQKVQNPKFVEMVCDIIRSFGNEKGIGLGSQVSQLLAISYLSDLDHEIKEKMKIRCYSRYSDDIVLIHPNKEYLQKCRQKIVERLSELGLELNPKSTLHHLRQGITYLKFRFILTPTGKVIYYITQNSVVRTRQRIMRLVRKYKEGKITIDEVRMSFNAWVSFALKGFKKYRLIRLKRQIERTLKNENYQCQNI